MRWMRDKYCDDERLVEEPSGRIVATVRDGGFSGWAVEARPGRDPAENIGSFETSAKAKEEAELHVAARLLAERFA